MGVVRPWAMNWNIKRSSWINIISSIIIHYIHQIFSTTFIHIDISLFDHVHIVKWFFWNKKNYKYIQSFLGKELLNETYQLPHGSLNNYQVIEIMDKKKKETTRIKLCNLIHKCWSILVDGLSRPPTIYH